jgi:hypothetical protein
MLSRDRLEKAIASLDWMKVEAALAAGGGRAADVEEIAGVVLRTSALVFRKPAPEAEGKREKLLEEFRTYFHPTNIAKVEEAFATLQLAEAGYRTIVTGLDATEAGKLPAEEQITAAMAICEKEVERLQGQMDAQQAGREYLSQHMDLRDEDGKLFSPDAALEKLVNMVGMTLQMHAYSHNWFDDEGALVAPFLDTVSDETIYKVCSTCLLAILWLRWENTEERARFIGRSMRYVPKEEWTQEVPEALKVLVRHEPEPAVELLHQVAFERLRDGLSQNFFEMMSDASVEHIEVGNKHGPHPLPPVAFVSRIELHAASAVRHAVNYDIAEDLEKPGGARLLEWVRGYAALEKLDEAVAKGTRIRKSKEAWVEFFVNWGLEPGSAEAFIRGITFRRGSRDLFDHPLIKLPGGDYLLFRHAFHAMNIAQVVFSTLSQLREPLQKKGDGFEDAVIQLFQKQGLKAYRFTEKRHGETYQVDALVPWGKYLFLFECKNRALPALHPLLMQRFDEETLENLEQVKRIARGLQEHPDILAKHLPAADLGKELVVCVLNAMPYCIPGGLDGVYFYDFSALGRFFKSGQVMAHTFTGGWKRVESTPWLRIWAGDTPNADDLLAQLSKPVQFTAVEESLELVDQGFPLPDAWWVSTDDFRRKEHEAIAALARPPAPAPAETRQEG